MFRKKPEPGTILNEARVHDRFGFRMRQCGVEELDVAAIENDDLFSHCGTNLARAVLEGDVAVQTVVAIEDRNRLERQRLDE